MVKHVIVTGSPGGVITYVYRATDQDYDALNAAVGKYISEPINGKYYQALSLSVLDALGDLGYKVVSTIGKYDEIIWTMARPTSAIILSPGD